MKKIIIILTVLLSLVCLRGAQAEEIPALQLQEETSFVILSLDEVKSKIRKKESFYLFIGRIDNVDAQLAQEQLLKAQEISGETIYFLDTKGVATKPYKAFSKKYGIRSMAYLSYFSNRKQVAVYHNNWRADLSDLLVFLEQE